jgi:hypothetical protein
MFDTLPGLKFPSSIFPSDRLTARRASARNRESTVLAPTAKRFLGLICKTKETEAGLAEGAVFPTVANVGTFVPGELIDYIGTQTARVFDRLMIGQTQARALK